MADDRGNMRHQENRVRLFHPNQAKSSELQGTARRSGLQVVGIALARGVTR